MKIKRCVYILITLLLVSCNFQESSLNSSSSRVSIHDIQGCAHISPMEGESVSGVKGIVTWKVENGFFMQDPIPDDQDCSSEGIFVFTDSYPDVIPGDEVSVEGVVSEFISGGEPDENLSVTEIEAKNVQLIAEHSPLPATIVLGEGGRIPPVNIIEDDEMSVFDPETDGLDFYESLEGMRVEISTAIVVQAKNSYGEIFVIPSDFSDQNIISAEGALIQTESDNNPERILVDIPSTYKKKIQVGDRINEPIIGIMDYEYGNYRVLEINFLQLNSMNRKKQETVKAAKDGTLRIATYNVNNYNRFNEDKLNELADQIENDLGLPDILVLQEVQDDSALDDDGTISAEKNIKSLIGALFDNNDILYHYVDPVVENNSSGGAQGGNIRTVILYRNDRGLERVRIENDHYLGDVNEFSNSRIPTIVKFKFYSEYLYIVGVHLVSNNLNTPLFGHLQPPQKPEEEKRIKQAIWIGEVVDKISMSDSGVSVIVLGDFNDTPWSTTLLQLNSSGMCNTNFLIDKREAYSFIYEGNASLFDQILVTSNLIDSIVMVQPIHINTWKQEKDQISDHDPIVIDIDLRNKGE
jgi:predicted extracellular nuclease